MTEEDPAKRKSLQKLFRRLLSRDKYFIRLAAANSPEIKKYNEKTLSTLSLLGGLLMLLPLLAVPFSETKRAAVPVYIVTGMHSGRFDQLDQFCSPQLFCG